MQHRTTATELRRWLMAGAALGLVPALLPAPAAAQDSLEEVVVTGSRIARQDYVSNSPISTVSEEALRATGQVTVESVLNDLPQIAPGLTTTSNNPGGGQATVDLRALGPQRTLVLVNGRRFVPGAQSGYVDLNNVPSYLIDRVEIVTGGGSATYGSDGLGGVVNFILRDDFEGVQLSTQGSITQEGDADDATASLMFGTNFAEGRGNIVMHGSYYTRDGVFNSERDWSAVDINGGSSVGVNTRVPALPGFDTLGVTFNPDGSIRPWNNTLDVEGGDRYNFAPVNYLIIPQERANLGAMAHYDITDNVTAYADFSFADNRVPNQLAATPAGSVGLPLTISLSDPALANPLLPPSLLAAAALRDDPTADLQIFRRMVEVGPRQANYNSKTYQTNFGLRGTIFEKWNWDVYGAYGRSELTSEVRNDVSRSKVQASLNGCPPGAPTGCRLIDFFRPGGITADDAAWLRLNVTDRQLFERFNAVGSITGDLIELPAGPLGVAFGVEYREDSSDFRPDDDTATGEILGFNPTQAIGGSYDVKEVFGEVNVPVVKDLPFAQYVGLEAGLRYSDYSTVGSVYTYKAGGEWTPVEDVRFRGLYQRATRAPSVFELFEAGSADFPIFTDPCAFFGPDGSPADTPPTAAQQALCIAQGVPATAVNSGTFSQSNAQAQALNVGNTDLKEETSDTYTIGAVFTPTFVDNVQISVDYWNIKVDDYIDRPAGGVSGVLSRCFAQTSLTDPNCLLVERNIAGDIQSVRLQQGNTSTLKTSGVDVQANYRLDLEERGAFDFGVLLTWLDKYELTQTADDGTTDTIQGVGLAAISNLGYTLPEWRGTLTLTYSFGPAQLTYRFQYEDSVRDGDETGEKIDAQTYSDISFNFDVTENISILGGVNNVFNNKPPLFTDNVQNNTDPSLYDVYGRRFFAGATLRF